jgi:hypothetical protein
MRVPVQKEFMSKFDVLAKNPKYCHSRESGSPELFEITGFLPSRE